VAIYESQATEYTIIIKLFVIQVVREAVLEVNSLEDLLRILYTPQNIIDLTYGGICGNATIQDHVSQLLGDLSMTISNYPFPNPVCDDQILNDLARWGVEAARNIITANNHGQLCR